MDEEGIVNNAVGQNMCINTDIYNFKSEEGGITLDKSFEDMINETYETMMKNRQLKTNEAPVMNPFVFAKIGCVDVHPLAPKLTKLKLIKPKLEPSLNISPHSPRILINTQAEPSKIQSPSMFTPFSSSVIRMQMSSLEQNPQPFLHRSYTWSGLDGLQPKPTLKHIPTTHGAKPEVGYSSSEVAKHSFVKPVASAGRRKLLPKPALSINQNQSYPKRGFNKPSIKFSPCSPNTWPPTATAIIPRDSGLYKFESVKTEDTSKIEVLGQEKKLELKFPIIPSSWSAREDPVKMKKNEQERERRLEMAVYRERLRNMLPRTQFVKKVSSAVILQAAKDHCQNLQSQLHILESIKQIEERKQKILTLRLSDVNYLRNISLLSPD